MGLFASGERAKRFRSSQRLQTLKHWRGDLPGENGGGLGGCLCSFVETEEEYRNNMPVRSILTGMFA